MWAIAAPMSFFVLPKSKFMGFENNKALIWSSIVVLTTFCYLLPNEFGDARTFGARRNSLELVKHNGTIKSIESENGEVIDCVDIYKQPAFDHPLLKNHTIEPNSIQNGVKRENNQALMALQGWHKNGECPEGTIPILRTPIYVNHRKSVPFISHESRQHNRSYDLASPGHEAP
ncbi:hypothetical protein TorRG33x02_244940 [Trema orientale]|uniref:Neprosin activation peptide domain-containing protein n=1 Tax=Trema orientale TaxID=63057 RepID=A0A2P5DQS2_TREOI|nr:hypothetical protein TorRG33x02_244940 [Trema orientale]